MTPRHFTIEEANALVPWLRDTFTEVRGLRDRMATGVAAARDMTMKSHSNGGGGAVDRHLADIEKELTKLNESIQQRMDDVQRKGIIVRDVDRGLVDFPSLRDGREVHLCWVLGEDAVGFWHETDTGFGGRKPL